LKAPRTFVTLAALLAAASGCRRTPPTAAEGGREDTTTTLTGANVVVDSDEARRQREKLVDEVDDAVKDERVLSAVRNVPRHAFVPDAPLRFAYADQPLPIGHGQTISQPTVVAMMTEALQLRGGERVLEIGTGSGYQAAILGRLAREVYTIEIVPELGEEARQRLERLGFGNVQVRIGDGYAGWPERAPFDRIILTAAPPEVPRALLDQLADGGILVAPVGREGEIQTLRPGRKKGNSALCARRISIALQCGPP
jgi:protein-L-isoaspartate(D-aspartate) O-methyltransferase